MRKSIKNMVSDIIVTLYGDRWLLIYHGDQFRSVQLSRSVVSNSLRPHESQHARPPCPSPSPRVHSDSRPSSQWCHPVISSSVVPFSSCPQSLPASESFPMSQLFSWGGQSTGVSALVSFLPKKSQGWSPAYKLNKHGDNIWNQSVVPCPVLTVASWLAYRFLRR